MGNNGGFVILQLPQRLLNVYLGRFQVVEVKRKEIDLQTGLAKVIRLA